MRRIAVIGIVLSVVLLAGAAAYVWAAEPEIDPIARPERAAIDPALVEVGAQIAAVGNCIACHTVHGGQALPAGSPCRHRSARSIPPTSPPTRSTASATGASRPLPGRSGRGSTATGATSIRRSPATITR